MEGYSEAGLCSEAGGIEQVAARDATEAQWIAATLDEIEQTGAVFEVSKFMLPWAFAEEAAAEKHMAQLQYNMWVVLTQSAVLGNYQRWEVGRGQDLRRRLYQHLLLTAEKKFWRCVQSGEPLPCLG